MKEYLIKTFDNIPQNPEAIPYVSIDSYVWGKEYTPKSKAGLIMIKNQGFYLYMECREKEPRAVYHNYNDPVYTDSCLEFFAKWYTGSDKYINMEMNSAGALLSCVGSGRENRRPLSEFTGGKVFRVDAVVNDNYWSVSSLIPFSVLEQVYGIDKDIFASGYCFSGNFYKCGDNTQIPHYGSWNRVLAEKPDFHRPECFGKLIIE